MSSIFYINVINLIFIVCHMLTGINFSIGCYCNQKFYGHCNHNYRNLACVFDPNPACYIVNHSRRWYVYMHACDERVVMQVCYVCRGLTLKVCSRRASSWTSGTSAVRGKYGRTGRTISKTRMSLWVGCPSVTSFGLILLLYVKWKVTLSFVKVMTADVHKTYYSHPYLQSMLLYIYSKLYWLCLL